MNKLIAVIFSLFVFAGVLSAQNEFPKVWETKTAVDPKWNAWNDDLSMILVGDLKELEMIDGTNGKSLWAFNVKEKLGVKSLEDWAFLIAYEGEPVKLIYRKPKEDAKTTVFLDPKTGQITSAYTDQNLKEKNKVKRTRASKAVYKTAAIDKTNNTVVSVSYKDKLVTSAGAGTEMDLTVQAVGGNNWTNSIRGKCVRHLCDNLLSSDEPTMMINVTIIEDKVLVIYEGISVLDLKTGNVLWTTTYDNVSTSVGLKVEQEIGRSAFPVGDKEAIYMCDFTKGERCIKKLDINTGNVIWKSDKLSSDDIVSQLLLVNNTLVAKFGGIIRKEKYVPSSDGAGTGTYKVEYKYDGKTDIRAYETSTGKLLWNSEKVSSKEDNITKSECNISSGGNNVFFCSNKNFYVIDAATGTVSTKTDIQPKNTSKPQYMYLHNGKVIVEGENGIASFTEAGALNYSVNTGKCLYSEFRGDAFIVWTGKDIDDMKEFIRMDIETGKIFGKKEGCYRPRFDTTGDYFLFFNKNVITKYKTN